MLMVGSPSVKIIAVFGTSGLSPLDGVKTVVNNDDKASAVFVPPPG